MINVVYFVFLNPDRYWHKIVIQQLNDFRSLKLDCRFFIQVDYKNKYDKIIFETIVNNIFPDAFVSYHNENFYEFNGINKIYNLAKENPQDLFLYFHSKGMLFSGNGERTITEKKLFNVVIKNYQKVLEIFDTQNVDRVAFCFSNVGFGWFNFWWAKGEYIINCEKPIKTEYRYYYEDWLSRNKKNDVMKCYSLSNYKNHIGEFYDANEACIANENCKLDDIF
jgi:hypothetical protein